MRFTETALSGAYVVELEPHTDDRGFLARAFCRREFAEHELVGDIAQANFNHSYQRGTVRGLHYQVPPDAEAKFVRCVRGAIYDVIVDLRPDSSTFRQWVGIELSEENALALYVPPLFAHGFQTMRDDTLLFYHASAYYSPDSERGLHYDDPVLGIDWPEKATAISDKDANWPLLDPAGA